MNNSERPEASRCTGDGRRWNAALAELAGWCLLGGLISIGNPGQLFTHIPSGEDRETTVPTFNAWTIGWNAHAWRTGLREYWNAPIFAPMPGTFTYSEAQPTTWIVVPLAGMTGSLALAYNVYLILLLGLNCWTFRHLLIQAAYPPVATVCGGLLILVLPFVQQQLGVLQLVGICGPISVIWTLRRFAESGRWRDGLLCGACASLTYAACNYYGLFLSLMAPALLILMCGRLSQSAIWLKLFVAIGFSALLVSPILYAQLRWLVPQAQPRSLELIQELSAEPAGLLTPYIQRYSVLKLPTFGLPEPEIPVGVGSLMLVMAAVGACSGLIRTGRRQWTLFCLVLGAWAGLLSFGPALGVGDFCLYEWLMSWYPGLRLIRSPYRLAMLVQLAIACLAIEGLDAVHSGMIRRWGARNSTAHSLAIVIATLLMTGQTWPPLSRLMKLPSDEANAGWVTWLRDNSRPREGIICLPFPKGRSIADYQETADWMYLGLKHARPMVNGYSGFFPEHYRQLRTLMSKFPDNSSLVFLRQWGVRYAVVRQADAASIEQASTRLPLVFEDHQAHVRIYDLN